MLRPPRAVLRPAWMGFLLLTLETIMAPARGPPLWQSRVLRRRYGKPHDAGQA